MKKIIYTTALALLLIGAPPLSAELNLSPAQAQKIGRQLWQNECAGTVEGLTSWNKGEAFPSLGIGHFIWYPTGVRQTYQESFPGLIDFLVQRGAKVPSWLRETEACPWPTRAAFLADLKGPRLSGLRQLLAQTVGLQAEYAADRARQSLGKILSAAPRSQRDILTARYDAVATSPQGVYALMDYVNFKGEGTNPKERYGDIGWGLLQVLQEMKEAGSGPAAASEFSAAAKRTLARRIANAPKPEGQWRAGWFNRCDTYARPLK
jgi:hypothetical protein